MTRFEDISDLRRSNESDGRRGTNGACPKENCASHDGRHGTEASSQAVRAMEDPDHGLEKQGVFAQLY